MHVCKNVSISKSVQEYVVTANMLLHACRLSLHNSAPIHCTKVGQRMVLLGWLGLGLVLVARVRYMVRVKVRVSINIKYFVLHFIHLHLVDDATVRRTGHSNFVHLMVSSLKWA